MKWASQQDKRVGIYVEICYGYEYSHDEDFNYIDWDKSRVGYKPVLYLFDSQQVFG